MSGFRVEQIPGSQCLAVLHGNVRAAVIYPPEPDGRVAIYPWPRTYPTLTFEGLPAPLKPEWDWHLSLEAVMAFLDIEQHAEAA